MISLIDKLRDLVENKHISNADSGTTIVLSEKQQNDCGEIYINKGNTRTLVLEFDLPSFDIHPSLKPISKLKKVPDYIIFCENPQKSDQIFIFIVELKSSNSDDWHRQAKAGLSIAQYLVGMVEGYEKIQITNIEYRCLLFHSKNPRTSKKKKISEKSFSYEKHKKLGYLFSDKPCNTIVPYSLPLFLR